MTAGKPFNGTSGDLSGELEDPLIGEKVNRGDRIRTCDLMLTNPSRALIYSLFMFCRARRAFGSAS